MDIYTVQRTRLDYSDLRDAHDSAQIGDVILCNGGPAFKVASRTRLNILAPDGSVIVGF